MSSFLKKEKQYGLIIPNRKVTAKKVTRPSAFGDSSSDEVRMAEMYSAQIFASSFAGR